MKDISKRHAAITNGALFSSVSIADRTTAEARRFRDLCEFYERESLVSSPIKAILVRRAAMLTVLVERLEEVALSREGVNATNSVRREELDHYGRATGYLVRMLRSLGFQITQVEAQPDDSFLMHRYGLGHVLKEAGVALNGEPYREFDDELKADYRRSGLNEKGGFDLEDDGLDDPTLVRKKPRKRVKVA